MKTLKYIVLMLLLTVLSSCGGSGNTNSGLSFFVDPAAVTETGFNASTNTFDSKTFTIHGGTPPYTVTSDNQAVIGPNPIPLNPDGQSFTVNPGAVSQKTVVTLNVSDSAGNSTSSIVTVEVPAFTIMTTGFTPVTSDTISIGAGGTATYIISGGVPPYNTPVVTVGNLNDIELTLNGSSFTVKLTNTAVVGETFKLTVTDSQQERAQLTLTVGN